MKFKKIVIGNCELYQGDCLEVLPGIGSANHVITDPPYEKEAHTSARRVLTKAHGRNETRKVERLAIEFDQISEDVRKRVAKEIARITDGWSLIFCQVEGSHLWREALKGSKYRRTGIWVKPDGAPQFTGDRPGMGYESIVMHWHGQGRSSWNGGGKHGVFTHSKSDPGYGHGGKRNEHPTQKPIKLMKELVSLFSQPGSVVLDPFMGSGSTGVACVHTGRRFIGIEQNAAYFELACQRIAEARSQPDLFIPS
jgi:site-specific DNA-methyltransferase (adenine-specific)